MTDKIVYKYYVTRTGATVIVRRAITEVRLVKSVLYKKGSDFILSQVSCVGGKVIGTMPYVDWVKRSKLPITEHKVFTLDKQTITALKPFLYKGN